VSAVSTQRPFLGGRLDPLSIFVALASPELLEASCFDPGMRYSEVGCRVFGDRSIECLCRDDGSDRGLSDSTSCVAECRKVEKLMTEACSCLQSL